MGNNKGKKLSSGKLMPVPFKYGHDLNGNHWKGCGKCYAHLKEGQYFCPACKCLIDWGQPK